MGDPLVCASNRILLHIGYHKTATTWFQSELFGRTDLDFRPLSCRTSVHLAFCRQSPFGDDDNDNIRFIVSEARDVTARGECFVVSHERLSGYPASGGYDSRQIADRLKRHFPNARIFCLFREQRAMILSAWRQYVVDGGSVALSRFLDPPEPEIRRLPLFDAEMYRYSRLLNHYRSLFGEENVLFLPYEVFCTEPRRILAGISELLHNEKLAQRVSELAMDLNRLNPGISMPLLGLQRYLNLLFARSQLSQHCLLNFGTRSIRSVIRVVDRHFGRRVLRGIDSHFKARALRRISTYFGDFFDEDNARLSTMTRMQLSDWGYRVCGEPAR